MSKVAIIGAGGSAEALLQQLEDDLSLDLFTSSGKGKLGSIAALPLSKLKVQLCTEKWLNPH